MTKTNRFNTQIRNIHTSINLTEQSNSYIQVITFEFIHSNRHTTYNCGSIRSQNTHVCAQNINMSLSRPELDFSVTRKRSVNRRANDVNTSVTVELTHRPPCKGHVRGSMSSAESAPPHLLMQNVRDIRKRLLETEKTLNKITKAEAKVEHE